MKYLAFCTVIACSRVSFPCDQQEAQFIGTATQIEKFTSGSHPVCFFQIIFSDFRPSLVCPLNETEIQDHRFEDQACTLNEGSDVSGVIVKKQGVTWIE